MLLAEGAQVRAIDPHAEPLPPHLIDRIIMPNTLQEALDSADGAVVTTEWPEFREITIEMCQHFMRRTLILDPNSFLATQLSGLVEYYTVGKP